MSMGRAFTSPKNTPPLLHPTCIWELVFLSSCCCCCCCWLLLLSLLLLLLLVVLLAGSGGVLLLAMGLSNGTAVSAYLLLVLVALLVGTDVVLVAVEPHISSPGKAGGISRRLINIRKH